MITPSIGRIVWVFATEDQVKHWRNHTHHMKEIAYEPGGQAMPGIVCYVHSDSMVNLRVTDHNGNAFPLTSCKLLQDDEQPGGEGFWAEWMPFQKANAK
jgi:hypothetical protein